MVKLMYFSEKVVDQLKSNIEANKSRYLHDGFTDLLDNEGWGNSLDIEIDYQRLKTLDCPEKTALGSSDVINSLIVGEALYGLSAADANEAEIWTRLSHVECIDYTRKRWIKNLDNDEKIRRDIKIHFFADTQTKRRDDHSISRLWWNYYIAKKCMPEDIPKALDLFVAKTDIRSNFVERIWSTSRKNIATAVLRALADNDWLSIDEVHFRKFMKALNRLGAGVIFEEYSESEMNYFVEKCIADAKKDS